MDRLDEEKRQSALGGSGLKRLTEQQVRQIDIAFESVGEYAEVHLIIQHGELN